MLNVNLPDTLHRRRISFPGAFNNGFGLPINLDSQNSGQRRPRKCRRALEDGLYKRVGKDPHVSVWWTMECPHSAVGKDSPSTAASYGSRLVIICTTSLLSIRELLAFRARDETFIFVTN